MDSSGHDGVHSDQVLSVFSDHSTLITGSVTLASTASGESPTPRGVAVLSPFPVSPSPAGGSPTLDSSGQDGGAASGASSVQASLHPLASTVAGVRHAAQGHGRGGAAVASSPRDRARVRRPFSRSLPQPWRSASSKGKGRGKGGGDPSMVGH